MIGRHAIMALLVAALCAQAPAWAAQPTVQRMAVEIFACDYNAEKQTNWLHGKNQQHAEIIFTMPGRAADICKRFRIGRQYIVAYTDWNEEGPEVPTAILKKIQPK